MTASLSAGRELPSLPDRHGEPADAPPLLSVVVPCYDEKGAVEDTIRQLFVQLAEIPGFEIIAVDDGSTDGTGEILDRLAAELPGLKVLHHHQNRGYGGALKTGIRNSRAEYVAVTDSDGTYPNDRIPEMLAAAEAGSDMVVGARVGAGVTYSKLRAFPKAFMRAYCIWLTRRSIPDLNSGLRVFRRAPLMRYLPFLPNTFSFTTTVTIAFMTNDYRVAYLPISYAARIGQSKISPIKDTIRFVQLIIRTGLYFAPLRVFLPLIVLLWAGFAAALSYDVFVQDNLSDKTLALLTLAMNVTILALLADMIDKRLS